MRGWDYCMVWRFFQKRDVEPPKGWGAIEGIVRDMKLYKIITCSMVHRVFGQECAVQI